jgi:CRISPR-associated exonuclease Cas4
MQYGIEVHLELDQLEKRRTFKRYNFKNGERKFHAGLYSPRLGLEGKLDMHIVSGAIFFPLSSSTARRGRL